jgi:hypothetical protein
VKGGWQFGATLDQRCVAPIQCCSVIGNVATIARGSSTKANPGALESEWAARNVTGVGHLANGKTVSSLPTARWIVRVAIGNSATYTLNF